jgi:hypothetical protein
MASVYTMALIWSVVSGPPEKARDVRRYIQYDAETPY